MRRKTKGLAALLGVVVGLLAAATPARADGPVTLLVFDRPPYYVRNDDGSFSGLVVDRVAEAFRKADVPYQWRFVEPNGHLKLVQRNAEPVCAVGWFYKPEREKVGLYTAPVYQDRPQVTLIRSDNEAALHHLSADALIADKSLRMGAKIGYSYGDTIDGLVAAHHPMQIKASINDTGLIRMLLGRRFDYFFTAQEEAEILIESIGEAGKDIAIVSFQDIPRGNTRHLICSAKVDRSIVGRINAALAEENDP